MRRKSAINPLQHRIYTSHYLIYTLFATLLLILFGAALRTYLWGQNMPFHPDEALFSTFARRAAIQGHWWLPGALDKPPLALYLNALAQAAVGDSVIMARLPGLISSILLLPVMYALAQALYPRQRHLPLLTLALLVNSPMALAYGPTAFTDGPMLLAITLALLMSARHHWGWSGIWLGIGIACKLQAALYLPLLVLLAWASKAFTAKHGLRFIGGLALMLILLFVWDVFRLGGSLFILALTNNNPARLIRRAEVLPRLSQWLTFTVALIGPVVLSVPLFSVALLAPAFHILKRISRPATYTDLVLLSFTLGYLLLHWLVAFNIYERYLLLLIPPVLLLTARGLRPLLRCRWGRIALVGLLTLLALTASAHSQTLNRTAYDYRGIEDMAAFLQAQPVATVIYDHWLGWELGYYLGPWHDKRLTYYPTPAALVQDALALKETGPRYLPVPRNHAPTPWLEALMAAGFTVDTAYTNAQFTVYRLIPPVG